MRGVFSNMERCSSDFSAIIQVGFRIIVPAYHNEWQSKYHASFVLVYDSTQV